MDKDITSPFFSIIIPTYNRALLIGKTIDSVLQQQYTNYEIIVVDDGSNDNTEELLKKYSAANFIYIKKENEERAAARNYGTKIARGKYINWFDSDDIMFPNHLTEARNMIEKYNEVEIFALGFQVQNSGGTIVQRSTYSLPTVNKIMYQGNHLACNPVFVRRDIALQNLFNEDRALTVSEDFELWLRMASQFPIYCTNTITSAFIIHSERSMTTMNTEEKLIPRFEKINQLVIDNNKVAQFLGSKKGLFLAINYMLLSSTLAIGGYKKQAIKFSFKAIGLSKLVLFKKTFFVTVWYLSPFRKNHLKN